MTTSLCGVTTLQSKSICISLNRLLTIFKNAKTLTSSLFHFFFRWWSEVPVILAITAATGIMGNLSYHVYKNEKRTSVYTHSGCRLSIKVFKQSFWFVVAFYITWAPYLALQVGEAEQAVILWLKTENHTDALVLFSTVVHAVFRQRI